MDRGSARRFRNFATATLRKSALGTAETTAEATATESTEPSGTLDRSVVDASVSALEEKFARIAGGKLTDTDQRVVDAGRAAGNKILAEGTRASLSGFEKMALEAIAIADGSRPALLFRDNSVDPGDPMAQEWADELRDYAAAIKAVASSIGRIDSGGRHVGTGWMIRPGYIATNRHVAQVLSKDPTAKRLELSPLRAPTICFGCEADESKPSTQHAIKDIVFSGDEYIDPYITDFTHLDMAVLKVDPATAGLPPPIPGAVIPQQEVKHGTNVFAFGYPGPTSSSSLPQKTLLRLLGEHVGVKRMSPGEIDLGLGGVTGDTLKRTIAHDATTLGGSSGSTILGFDTQGNAMLIGIHFGGYEVKYGPMGEVEYRGRNFAHCFSGMADVVRLIDAAVAADRAR